MNPPAAVELRRVRIPLRTPHAAAHGTETHRHSIIVRWETGEGPGGWGECATLSEPGYAPEWTAGAWMILHDYVVPAVLAGRPPGVLGHPMATGALADAALDAALRLAGRSLVEALGGSIRPLPTTAVLGIRDGPAALLAAVDRAVGQGASLVKVKLPADGDLAAAYVVREVFPDLALAADANGGLDLDVPGRLAAVDRLGLEYLEQPLAPDELVATAELAAAADTPIALDESLTSPGAARTALALGAAAVLNVKPGRLGGVAAAADVVALAAEAGVDAFVGGLFETGIGRAGALAVAALPGCTLPTDLGPSDRYFERDLTAAIALGEDGTMAPLPGPGIGTVPDLDRLDEVTVAQALFSR